MRIQSSFTHPHVVPNLYEFIKDILKNVCNQTILVPIDFNCIFWQHNESQWEPKLFGYKHSSKYLLLCSTEEKQIWNSMRVNDDRMFIFGWTIPLINMKMSQIKRVLNRGFIPSMQGMIFFFFPFNFGVKTSWTRFIYTLNPHWWGDTEHMKQRHVWLTATSASSVSVHHLLPYIHLLPFWILSELRSNRKHWPTVDQTVTFGHSELSETLWRNLPLTNVNSGAPSPTFENKNQPTGMLNLYETSLKSSIQCAILGNKG